MTADRIPVLLDTDIGSDIDDAVALAYLLRQPLCELLGITTVSGDVAKRAACAEVICRRAGRHDVPIHCGLPGPLLWGPGQPHVPQYDAVREMAHRINWPGHTAIEFLRHTIRRRPGEVTLLTIGPFTNAALLFAVDPEIPSLLKGMVSMAGDFFSAPPINEWNCKVDPISTAVAYRSAPRGHLSVGLDVTMKCQLDTAAVREHFRKPPLDVVLSMAEVWFEHSTAITFHDPLAAALLFHPGLCSYAIGEIEVDASEDPARSGRTVFTQGDEGRQRVARDVDPAAFFREYFSVFE